MPTFADYLRKLKANTRSNPSAKEAWDTIYQRSGELEKADSQAKVGAWLGRIFDTVPVDPEFENDLNFLANEYRKLQANFKYDEENKPTPASQQQIQDFNNLILAKLMQTDFLANNGYINKNITDLVLTPDVLNHIKQFASELDIAAYFLRSYALTMIGSVMKAANPSEQIFNMPEEQMLRNSLLAGEININLPLQAKQLVLTLNMNSSALTKNTLTYLINDELYKNIYAHKVINALKGIEDKLLQQNLSYKEGQELIQNISYGLKDSGNLGDIIRLITSYTENEINFTTFKSLINTMAAQAKDFMEMKNVIEEKHAQKNTADVDQQVLLDRLDTLKLTKKHVDYGKVETNELLDKIKQGLSLKWVHDTSKLVNNSENYQRPEMLQASLQKLDVEITAVIGITEKVFGLRQGFKSFLSADKATQAIFLDLEKQAADDVHDYSRGHISFSQFCESMGKALEAKVKHAYRGNLQEMLLRGVTYCKSKRDVDLKVGAEHSQDAGPNLKI